MRKQEKIGYGLVGVAVVFLLLGSIGFTTFISATVTLKWDRDDIYVVVADEDEKKRCESEPPGIFNQGTTMACGPYDADVLAGGTDGEEGLIWDVESGVHYAGIGTVENDLPSGVDVNMSYSVHLQASFATYFLFALIGIGGLAYSRVE